MKEFTCAGNTTATFLPYRIVINTIKATLLLGLLMLAAELSADAQFRIIGELNAPEARQGIAVDRKFFYPIDSRIIARHRKDNGIRVQSWHDQDNTIIHLNSGVVVNGKLFTAHSSWPKKPYVNSIKIWDAETLQPVMTRQITEETSNALNWLDFFDNSWWGGFAYFRISSDDITNFGHPYLARFDDNWRIAERWSFPAELLKRFENMSNSGGSWGPDGFLYLTGHDRPEIYKVNVPKSGGVLKWLNTLPLPIRGQGIAWDRDQGTILYGIVRATDNELRQGKTNKVVILQLEGTDNPSE